MKKLTILFASIIFLAACDTKETRVFKFTQHVNDKENEIKDDFLIKSKAFYVNKKEINLDLIVKTRAIDTIPGADIPKIEKTEEIVVNEIAGEGLTVMHTKQSVTEKSNLPYT